MYQFTARLLMASLLLLGGLAAPVHAQDHDAPPVLLNFARGQAEIVVRGTVTGYQTLNYAFDAARGDQVSVRLEFAGGASLYHNVIAPSGETIFNGSVDGDRFQASVRERGRYQVRVYLMRNDARRGKRVPFTLRIRQSEARPSRPPQAGGPSFDCRRAAGPVETAVCRSPALSELDTRLAFVYRDAIDGAPPRLAEEIRREQRRWLDTREDCARERGIERCLIRRYETRIGQLEPKR